MSHEFNEKLSSEVTKVDPELTQNFVSDVRSKAERGIYRVEVRVGDNTVPIDVFPEVFPPRSDYSVSSQSVFEAFGNLENVDVADIGSGSGIEAIVAALAGATHIDATDIHRVAVDCTLHNVEQNGLTGKVSVYHGDLFSALPKKKYGLIIANLPIVDFRPEYESGITTALYDPGFGIHKRMLHEAKKYLAEEGTVTFTHANLQSGKTDNPDSDFEVMERLILENGYQVIERKESEALGYKWVNYKIRPTEREAVSDK